MATQVTAVNSDGLPTPKLVHVIANSKDGVSIGSLTVLGDWLFVGHHSNDSAEPIDVYDTRTWSLLRQLTVSGLGHWVSGLAASITDNCLYVSDADHAAVHKIDLSNDKSVARWSVSGIPTGLWLIRKSGNLLVTCAGVERILEYSSDGQKVREVIVDAPSSFIQHAVQRLTGELVVSAFQQHCVLELGPDGRRTRSYGGGGPGSESHQLNCPREIAIDNSGSGRILVADSGNRRVVALDRSTPSSRCLLPLPVEDEDEDEDDEDLSSSMYPTSICLDESRDRLYVGEDGDRSRVLVFDCVTDVRQLATTHI